MWNAGVLHSKVICAIARFGVNICIITTYPDEDNGNRQGQDTRYHVHNIGRGSNRNN